MVTFVTPLPTPPSRQDPVNFSARGDAFLGALPQFQAELNSLGTDVEGVLSDTQTVFLNTQDVLTQTEAVRDQTLGIKQDTQSIKDDVELLKLDVDAAVGVAQGHADQAGLYADSAQAAAAAAGAAAGLPSLASQAGKALVVKQDETGVEWGDLAGTVPVTGAVYKYSEDSLFEHAGANWQRVDAIVPYSESIHNLSLIPEGSRQYVRQAITGSTGNFLAATYDGSGWLAINSQGVYKSSDRFTWTLATATPPTAFAGGVAGDAASGVYVAISGTGSGTSIYRSADGGVTWSTVSIGAAARAICFGGGLFVIAAEAGRIFTSADGLSWSTKGPITFGDFNLCTFTGDFFVAYRASDGQVWKSVDGAVWALSATIGTAYTAIEGMAGKVYFAKIGQIAKSADGVVFETISPTGNFPTNLLFSISSMTGRLVVNGTEQPGGVTKYYTSSDDGSSWSYLDYFYPATTNKLIGRYDDLGGGLFIGNSGFIGDIPSFTIPATIRFSNPSVLDGKFNLYVRTK